MKAFACFLIVAYWTAARAFVPGGGWEPSSRRFSHRQHATETRKATRKATRTAIRTRLGSTGDGDGAGAKAAAPAARIGELKTELLQKIGALNHLQEQDGKISVDFGVKGGEIDQKSRAPKKLDFYTVSERVGAAADAVFATVDELAKVNPTPFATEGFGDPDYEGTPPLDGPWNLLFSTAADANFSKDSKRGDARASNIVDARRGRITNVIKFAPSDPPRLVDELRVRLSATAENSKTVAIVFRYVAVKFTRLFFVPLRWTLYIPVPAPLIGKIVIALSNFKNRLLRKKVEPRKPPRGVFEVLFLDRELRVHKTLEDNLFVQARPDWTTAWEITGS
eukprot:jgi/Psemu1/302638/fgenesh1_kg.75_\